MTKRNLPIIRLVLCEVLKPIDIHEAGELIMIQEQQVKILCKLGVIRMVGDEEAIPGATSENQGLVQIAQDNWNGVVIRVPERGL